jgi:hypothetical protein
MTLLQDLIDGASGDAPVTSLLRKVKVVAARAGVGRLDEWVAHELNGYPEGVTLPGYRGPFNTEVRGDYSGPFNSGVKNGLVPRIGFPEDWRDSGLFNISFRESIAELEELSRTDEGAIKALWSADVVAYTNSLLMQGKVNLYDGLGLQSAWRIIPKTMVVAIIDTVRNRVLDLALTLERSNPDAGQVNAQPIPATVARNVINIITSSSPNIAVDSSNFTQTAMVVQGSREALDKQLTELGVPEPDIERLHEALESDGGPVNGELGPETSRWLARLLRRAESLGIESAGGVIAALISQFLGIG